MAGPAYRSPWGKNVGGAAKPPTTPNPGKKSFVAPWFGGASQPTGLPPERFGFRSVLAFFAGGGCKPPSRGDYAGPCSFLAFWMGGAALNYKPKPPYEPIIGPDGPGYAKHHERGRPIVDDDEVIEFLRLWTVWNDIE